MTIQWTLVATFLYCELAFITLLLLPIISPNVWHYLFESRICKVVASKANIYFSIFIGVLSLFFLESIREMRKYGDSPDHEHLQLGSEIQQHMKLFRSQRNFYIAGFALFLWFVIRRLVMLISAHSCLLSENESCIKRAQISTETAQKLLKQKEEISKAQSENEDIYKAEISSLQELLLAAENELQEKKSDVNNVKSQAEAITKEYDDLMKHYVKLANKGGGDILDTKE